MAVILETNGATVVKADDDLAEATPRVVFQQHPQMAIFTSFPGLGELPAVRLLAEIGDDATRFADALGLKAYASATPVTRASVPHRQAAAASSVPNVLRCHRITRASMSTMSHQLAASRGLPQTAPGLAMKAPVASQS